MKIIVFGWYDHDNLGDESYKISIKEVWPEHEFFFTDKLPQDINIFDLCIIGGGDVIREKSLNEISLLSCPKIALSVTITKESLSANIFILDHIYVRDELSHTKLKDFGYTNSTYIPDISIILTGDKSNGRRLISDFFKKSKSELYNKVYTIVINSHLLIDIGSTFKDQVVFFNVVNGISEVMDKTSASFLFIPFSTMAPWDDRISNGLVNSYTKFYNKNCVIYNKLSIKESLDIISASDAIITTRFHGLIFGLSNKIPILTISSHDKTSGFCETIGEEYIDYWSFSKNEFNRKIDLLSNTQFDNKKIKEQYHETVHFLWKK